MKDTSLTIVAMFIIVFLAGIALVIAAWRTKRVIPRTVLGISSAVVILVVSWLMVTLWAPHWINPRYSAYKKFYDGIEVGMSREQVLTGMEKQYPASGPRQRPQIVTEEPTELHFLMTQEAPSDPNAEGISVVFAGGKVTRKYYTPD